jgi:hypothetical protein
MNILITHQFTDLYGGSYIYTQELANVFKINHQIVVINDSQIDHNFNLEINSLDKIRHIDFDLIVIMQANHFKNLNIDVNDARIINIIHSEVYDCDAPYINNKTEYIAVRDEIKKYLISNYNIPENKITTLINPINKKFYNDLTLEKNNKKIGVFACNTLGQVRLKAAYDFAMFCKEINYESILIGYMTHYLKNEFSKIYNIILDPTEDYNKILNNCNLSGGILKGRTYWEAKLLGKAVVEYMVDPNGEILDEIHEDKPISDEIEYIKNITDPEFIASKILSISKAYQDSYNINEYFDFIYQINSENNIFNSFKIKSLKLPEYYNHEIMPKIQMESLITFQQIFLHAEKNNYKKILIIQDGAKISNNANEIFKEKFHKFKQDWQIIIFSNDYAAIALKREVYQELKKCIDLKQEFDQCITEQIVNYKTYIFSDRIIKY